MQDLDQVFVPVEINGQTSLVFKCRCDTCDREISIYQLRLSVFLYGIVLLYGKDRHYAGITCQYCARTTLLQGSELSRLIQNINYMEMAPYDDDEEDYSQGWQKICSLRYHYPDFIHHAELSSYTFYSYSFTPCDTQESTLISELTDYTTEHQNIGTDYLCAFDLWGEIPIGFKSRIVWIKEKALEGLLELENEAQLRIFPRYVHKMSFYEHFERFAWDNGLQDKELERLAEEAQEGLKTLAEIAKRENFNIDWYLENVGGSYLTPDVVDYIARNRPEERLIEESLAPSQFLNLLNYYDPNPWDLPISVVDCYKGIWQCSHKLRGQQLPYDFKAFDPAKFQPRISSERAREMAAEIHKARQRKSINVWLTDNYPKFVDEYLSISKRANFCYGALWDLKCRYLEKLHRIATKGTAEDARYGLFKEGASWTLIFEGEIVRGLKSQGCEYLQFLIGRPYESIVTARLEVLAERVDDVKSDGTELSFEETEELGASGSSHGKSKKKPTKKFNEDQEDLYKKRLSALKEAFDIKTKYERCKSDLVDGVITEHHDIDPIMYREACRVYYDTLNELKQYKKFGGKILDPISSDNITQRRISKAIERAVKEIGTFNKAASNHLTKALRPINSKDICYNPPIEINWFTG